MNLTKLYHNELDLRPSDIQDGTLLRIVGYTDEDEEPEEEYYLRRYPIGTIVKIIRLTHTHIICEPNDMCNNICPTFGMFFDLAPAVLLISNNSIKPYKKSDGSCYYKFKVVKTLKEVK